MKKTFYIYWVWFLAMMLINNIGIIAPLWVANIFKVSLCVNFVYLAFWPLFLILDNFVADQDKYAVSHKLREIDAIYLEGIIVSILSRGILYVFSVYKLDQRWDILSWVGLIMIVYYILEIRIKVIKIEKRYFKY